MTEPHKSKVLVLLLFLFHDFEATLTIFITTFEGQRQSQEGGGKEEGCRGEETEEKM